MSTVAGIPYKPQLVSVDDIAPAVYNPREADEMRLGYLTQSIQYLGFVLPLYATPEGHLLSGHQRLSVAKALGCTHVPVVYVDIKESRWKQVNLLFNRATNDMDADQGSELFLNELQSIPMDEIMANVGPLDPTSDEFFPCMNPVWMSGEELTEDGIRPYSSHATSYGHSLLGFKILMPALRCQETGVILNGSYRVYGGIEHQHRKGVKNPHFPVIPVSEERAGIAEALVNLVSMRFTVEKQMGNLLRYGGFRRPNNKVDDLVVSMRFWADGKKKRSASQSLSQPRKFWHNFRKEHGNTVADMGAGQRRNGLILRKKGIKCVDWEPYPCDWQRLTDDKADRPSLALSRMICNEFLDEIEAGTKFDSVFANAVINSIPFHKDRMAFIALCHAICSFQTGFYGTAKWIEGLNTKDSLPLNRIDDNGNVSEGQQVRLFEVPYEPGVLLADISRAPKIQKYHSREEMDFILGTFFTDWELYATKGAQYVFFEAHNPKRVNPYVLREALEMEFNMPFPEGKIGLVDRALQVFSQRHNLDLADPKYAPKVTEEAEGDDL